jgi:hypothetical protein
LAFEGTLKPLSLRTNCSDASRISSSVAGGSKLKSVLIFLHMGDSAAARLQRRASIFLETVPEIEQETSYRRCGALADSAEVTSFIKWNFAGAAGDFFEHAREEAP